MQQPFSGLKIFRESCVFFALAGLLPIVGILAFITLYEHNSPGDGIGEGLAALVVVPFCLIASLAIGLLALRRLPALANEKYRIIAPLVLTYASYYLAQRYYPHLTKLEMFGVWPIGFVVLPSCIARLVASLPKWRAIGLSAVVAAVVFVPLLIGSYALDNSQHLAAAGQFVTQANDLGYTLYMFPAGATQPVIQDISLGKQETTIHIFTGVADSENTPDLSVLRERQKPQTLPSPTCGSSYQATELSADQTNNYSCQLLASTPAGDIYQMSYTGTDSNGVNTNLKEYFMCTSTTVVYATYHNHSSNVPLMYDQEKSVGFLKELQPITGTALQRRLNTK